MVPVVDIHSDGHEPSAQWWAVVHAELEEQPWEDHEPDGGEAWLEERRLPPRQRRYIDALTIADGEPPRIGGRLDRYQVPTGHCWGFEPQEIAALKIIIRDLLQAAQDPELLITVAEAPTFLPDENQYEPGARCRVTAAEILPYFRRRWGYAHRERAIVSDSDF